MVDQFGRTIDYMRLSITDRCNLRCRYCMPNGVVPVAHADVLTYEEFLRTAAAGVELGITKFKVTGGEPLARLGCVDFIARLKALPGVEQVTMTTNGALLAPVIPRLAELGVDGVNVSLDAPDRETFAAVTGFDALDILRHEWPDLMTWYGGILAGTVLAFARALGEYGATSMLIGYTPGKTATISTTVYQLWRTDDEAGAFLWVLVNLAISTVVLLTANLLERRQKAVKQ